MFLIDINLLLARCDPNHTHHRQAVRWFIEEAPTGWATCPLTENGFIRILGHPKYPNTPGSLDRARAVLHALIQSIPEHRFIPADISILDPGYVPDLEEAYPNQLTDLYLLALAVCHDASFATFDRKIDATRIPGGSDAYHLLKL